MYKIGIDLGGTNIAVGVVNEKMEIIGRGKRKTDLPRSAEDIFKDMADATVDAIADAGLKNEDIESIGIGIPGSINKTTGNIEYANNLGFYMVPAKKLFAEHIPNIPIFIDNDANCAALGEAYAGAGKGFKDVVAITLGTGVGSGVVVDGKLVSGCGDSAGEYGHTVISFGGKQCNCGRKGCWEAYASATALIEQTKEKMLECKDSKMWELVDSDIDKVGGRTAFDGKRMGDKAATEVVDHYIYYVSVGVTNIINALQPDVLCVGGGISNEKDNLIIPLRDFAYKEVYNKNYERTTKICTAELKNDAGIIGAALLNR
ncbi:MAG: ROK family protein [Clostridia bacterium]|nr:ROK family protein [Clostridia bacterium]